MVILTNRQKKNARKFRRSLLNLIIVLVGCFMIIYGGCARRHPVYDLSPNNQIETPFYEWVNEPELTIGTTIGGFERYRDGRLVSLPWYREHLTRRTRHYCPS